MLLFLLTALVALDAASAVLQGGMLHPRESESRQIQDLCGMWHFRADRSPQRNAGLTEMWYKKRLAETGPVIPMPVPSSYNDITADRTLQNFIGWVWYDREFFVSPDWQNRRVVFRVNSAHYNAIVWINGVMVASHSGGHLPFEAAVNSEIDFSGMNWVTIAVNNTLTPHTLPTGYIKYEKSAGYPDGYYIQVLNFDFFNYAGLHRKVQLYTTPQTYIDDVTLVTGFSGTTGYLNYTVATKAPARGGDQLLYQSSQDVHTFHQIVEDVIVHVEVVDRNGTTVVKQSGQNGTLKVDNVHLWWPYTENTEFGYMYTFKITVGDDVYRQPFGFRTVRVSDTQLFINEKSFYCQGVAKHEDSDIRGKGLDYPLIARDFNMLKWMGANCFRTSHYPYAEEILDQADEQGIVIIDECPAVGLHTVENFDNKTLVHHLEVMEELVRRDKNRPAVIMWSVANEPQSGQEVAESYFKSVIHHTKQLDKSRLVTYVIGTGYNDKAAQFTDVLCINRYYGWYSDTGELATIQSRLSYDLDYWYHLFKKPLMITEYGADTVPGQHMLPSYVFTEDFQVDFLKEYHSVFDVLRKKFLVGEMVWNFADFMTQMTVTRVVGNRKGLFTRQRQPKASAHLMRERYWRIINETLPHSSLHSNTEV